MDVHSLKLGTSPCSEDDMVNKQVVCNRSVLEWLDWSFHRSGIFRSVWPHSRGQEGVS